MPRFRKKVHGDTAWARPGDWSIPEPTPGRFYPSNPDVFDATYEPIEPGPVTSPDVGCWRCGTVAGPGQQVGDECPVDGCTGRLREAVS